MSNNSLHSFHIPVMGLAYTVDTPFRVAHLGISSVISIIDDEILERMKNFYSTKFNLNYSPISLKTDDYRAKRITDYLNMMEEMVTDKFQKFKEELVAKKETLKNFIEILPDSSSVKSELQNFFSQKGNMLNALKNYIDQNLTPGNIDVNIMTKVDKDNFKNKEQLPVIYNDAHASLRGFAQSKLSASVVLSAGMNPRLYSYLEEFDDFYPGENNLLRKKIILKVSDFRSAMIQGQFLAKKGLWVSEYRIESGLNCGGHAFATEGLLLGPILEEFKNRKEELIESAHSTMISALQNKHRHFPEKPLELKITVQGGVGTAEEHKFLLNYFEVNSVGWGSPFLLVPEATAVDNETRKLLAQATEDDFYLSNLSPLGVLFNSVKGTSNDVIRKENTEKKRYGSSCPKKLLALSKEYSEEGICTASKKYQDLKLGELKKEIISESEFNKRKNEITEKACLCVGLVNAAYMENEMKIKGEKQGVVICPGPNLAYFDKEISLTEIIKHIYGKTNILSKSYRPNIFINELKMYVDYFNKNSKENIDRKEQLSKKLKNFRQNLINGIDYYENLFKQISFFENDKENIRTELEKYKGLLCDG
ncbi:hypothetical protein [Chryseobacterium sp.]|uniref:hypothetical protein n=1 Tax=Chryseobacterium sp. TaxID=1871047 RepID=UPI00289D18D1|nr:hypothetical protein [Chryseobacterium sp.]